VVLLFRFPASRVAILLVLVGIAVAGCRATPNPDPNFRREPPPVSKDVYPQVEKPTADALKALSAVPTESPPAGSKRLEVLAVSGGVAAAPYVSGVMVGWSKSGTRPKFDVVTGVSSGALIGAYAFLGPKYDANIEGMITSLKSSDLIKMRPVRNVIRNGSFGSAEPAEELIRREVNDEFLADLRQAHTEGRRLFVGTMDMDTKQLVIWDMGAIASSGKPDAADLVRKVFLATIAWPGILPPVNFDVEVNGQCHREQHFDGGSSAMVFVRFGPTPGWPEKDAPAKPDWLKGSNLYIFACRKLYSDPAPAPTRAVSRVIAYLGATFEALTRADIKNLHKFCVASGMGFHLLTMPQEVPEPPLGFGAMLPDNAKELFQMGYDQGAHPPWRSTPPDSDPGEEVAPRDGTNVTISHK
jgi:hypothetical protein